MPNYRRSNIAGGTYFFTLNSFRRRPILTAESLRHALRLAIQKTRLTHPFEIDAWVLLPDHLHCIWTLPQGDADFSIRWSMIKRLVSQACADEFVVDDLSASRTQRKESGIWQRRFWEHQIRDAHIQYGYSLAEIGHFSDVHYSTVICVGRGEAVMSYVRD